MKLTLSKVCILFFVLSLMLYSCDDIMVEKQDQHSGYAVEEGIIVFENTSDFNIMYQRLGSMNSSELAAWRSKNSYHSMEQFKQNSPANFHSIYGTRADKSVLAYDYILRNIVNDQGILKIGNSIFLYTKHKLYQYENPELSEITREALLTKYQPISSESIHVENLQMETENGKTLTSHIHNLETGRRCVQSFLAIKMGISTQLFFQIVNEQLISNNWQETKAEYVEILHTACNYDCSNGGINQKGIYYDESNFLWWIGSTRKDWAPVSASWRIRLKNGNLYPVSSHSFISQYP